MKKKCDHKRPYPKENGCWGKCPKCKRGCILEWHYWYCSRSYAKRNPCDWTSP